MTIHYEGVCVECAVIHTRTITTDGDGTELPPALELKCECSLPNPPVALIRID
jgi:hypothetical protein